MERDSFIFYRSFFEAIDGLPVENQAHIYKAIFCYALNGETIELDVWENAVFKTIKSQIDANNERFLNGCKGGEYGKLGGRPKKNESEKKPQENPKETPNKPQENPKETPNVNDNDNVNDNENDNDNVNYNENANAACNSAHACTREEIPDKAKEEFFKEFPSVRLNGADDSGIDYGKLLSAFREGNDYLQNTKSMNYVTAHYAEIIGGGYRRIEKPQTQQEKKNGVQLWQELMQTAEKAKEKRYSHAFGDYVSLYALAVSSMYGDKKDKNDMDAIYKSLSEESKRIYDKNGFMNLCEMNDDDLKYERARFLKTLPEIRRKREGNDGVG
ncbi:MAG: hypothetical protein HFE28_01330 [Clostridia bacterium]|nr:hypothetical protein [Clostridia bacterium]